MTLDWEAGTATGRQQAEELLTAMVEQQNPNLLLAKLRELLDRGALTAIEVGFFYYLAARLILRH